MKKIVVFFVLLLLVLSPIPLTPKSDWRTADRSSAHIAPLPGEEPQAIVQIYAAKAHGWRQHYGVHSWIATKTKYADHYMVYQVVGWRSRQGLPVVMAEQDIPDRKWYGQMPDLLFEAKGQKAEAMIAALEQAAQTYPSPDFYRIWPGPNSNSFIAHMIRQTPGITVELPPNAIGKDWLGGHRMVARSESGTGWQLSLYGLLGLTVGKAEGIELNILGLTFGMDVLHPALKLPFIGRLGTKDGPV